LTTGARRGAVTPERCAADVHQPRHIGAAIAGSARLGTRWPASCGHPGCRERATFARDPARCERPACRRGNSSAPGYGAMSRELHGSPAGCRVKGRKNFFCCACRVTTRRRKVRILNGLGRDLGSLTALPLRLGVASPGRVILAVLGLAPRRLPTTDFPLTLRIVTVALVPTPRQVLTIAPFAQARPQSRSTRSRSTRSSPTPASYFNLMGAHGSCNSQGKSPRRMHHILLGRLSTRARGAYSPVTALPRNKTAK
jgi:hypothetical protein